MVLFLRAGKNIFFVVIVSKNICGYIYTYASILLVFNMALCLILNALKLSTWSAILELAGHQ